MENKTSFFDAFGATINASEIAGKNGLSYIAAATAMRLAGRPEVRFVDFDGKPYLEMLGGSVVAVDLQVPGVDQTQRMWLPVMDQDNNPLLLKNTKVTDINNSRQRCLVKAIAATHGHGMSLYVNCDGDGAKAVKMLGVNPDSELEDVTPIISTLKEGGAPFIEWGIGLSACRITDPTFRWSVETYAGLPFREVLGGLMVDVQTVYEGMSQVLSLAIMDSTHNPISADKATPSDWNKAVMRALTKCISFNTGYGIGVYADEFGVDKEPKGGKGSRKATPATPATPAVKAEAKAADAAPATTAAVATQETAETPAAEVVNAGQADVEAQAQASEVATAGANADVVDAAGNTVAAAEVTEVKAQAETTETNAEAPVEKVAESAPAAQESAPAADAQASAPAAETKAAAATEAAADNEAVVRFRKVLGDRRKVGGVAGVVTLFDALKTSQKFEEADKPACFQVLVTSVAAIVDNENILDLLNNITKYNAMQYLAADARDLVAARLTSVLLTAALAAGDDALKTAPEDLVSAGVAQDVDDVLRLAVIGHVPAETVDLLRDVLEQAA